MHKSAILGFILMASLLLGTSLNMNMFSNANAQGVGQYDNSYQQQQQPTYGQDPYASSYEQSYSSEPQPSYGPQQSAYDQPKKDYSQSSYDDYSEYKTKDKKYECRTGPFEGFFVSSVEFCDAKNKFDHDDRKDKDNKTGAQGPRGPPGQDGKDGRDGEDGRDGQDGKNGTDGLPGRDGTNGTNGTDFDPCVACLLDALVKLDTGSVLVDISGEIDVGTGGTPDLVDTDVKVVIDLELAEILQAQLGETLLGDPNATIFEICAEINGTSLDIGVILAALEDTLTDIIIDELDANVNAIAAQVSGALGQLGVFPPNAAGLETAINAFITGITDDDIAEIVANITADVEVSLEIFNRCLEEQFGNGGAGSSMVSNFELPTVQQEKSTSQLFQSLKEMNPTIQQNSQALPSQNPTIQQNSQALPSGDPMLQLHSTLSPIS